MTNYAIKTGSRQHRENTLNAIRDLEPFETSGALRGVGWNYGVGRLNPNGADYEKFCRDILNINYIVYSYATPIAWHLTDGNWYIVQAKFSPTTATHQSVVSRALGS